MGESASAGLRERSWIDVFDHDYEPKRHIRQVFIENGVVQSITEIQSDTTLVTPAPDPRLADESAPQS